MLVSNRLHKVTAVLLTITGVFVASNIYTLIPIYEAISKSLHIGQNQVVFAGSLFSFFYALGLLYFGPASDKFGRRRIILFGMFASVLSTMAVGFSDNLISLYVSRSLQGLTLGSFAPVAFAYSFDLFTPKNRTLFLVFINTGFLMAGIFGQLISSSITLHFQWEYVFYFFALCYLLLFVCGFMIYPKTKLPIDEKKSMITIMGKLIRNKLLLRCYGITFTLLFSFVAFYDALGRFFAGAQEQLFILRAIGLTGAVLSLFTGKFIDYFGVDKTMFAGFLIGAGSLFPLLFISNSAAFMFSSIFFVASISILIPTVITLIGSLGGVHRAKALSLYSFFLLTGTSFASPVAIMLSFRQILALLIGFFLLNLISGSYISKEIRKAEINI